MLGFYAIRKMSYEAFQPVKAPPVIRLVAFPRNRKRLSPISYPEVAEAFDLTAPAKPAAMTVLDVCNQVIHSYFFALWFDTNRRLRGVFFCSDRRKDVEVYLLELPTIIKLFDDVAASRSPFASLAHFYPERNRVVF